MKHEPLHADFLSILQLNCGDETKRRLVNLLIDIEAPEVATKIEAISTAALEAYQANDFRPMKLNGSHRVDRVLTYRELIAHPIENADEWWAFIVDRGRCVLTTARENMTNDWSAEVPTPKGLFQGQGIQFSAKYRQRTERHWVEAKCAELLTRS